MIPEIEKTIRLEGGYINNLNDGGGETKYGISHKSYPDLDIKNLTVDDAYEIYKRDYWDRLGLDAYAFIPFRFKVFDIAVNMGIMTAKGFLDALQSSKDSPEAVNELVEMQVRRYVNIVVSKPSQIVFLKGWINRAFEKDLT